MTDLYDLAIVGYGPTGMTLAALAGQQGHRVIVLERHLGLYNLPRAACFDDEIMRTFQKLALVDEVLPGAVIQADYEWVNGTGDTLLELSYDNPAPGGWAALYMMYQPHIETVLDRRCKSLETVEVRQGVTIDSLAVDDDVVVLGGEDRDGQQCRVSARYVVGADGGAGFLRPTLGIGINDYRFQENWLVCDFRKRDGHATGLPTFRQVCDPAQPIAIVQIGPDHHRFSFMLEPDEVGDIATDAERVWERVSGYLSPDDGELIRVANYVFRSRIADRWRIGPVMLAGDAAHEMPPFLAQGMCSGIRDSHNLAWKLDLVLSGRAEPDILGTYQPEREPHVRFITEKAIELGRVQTLRDPDAARQRDARMLAQRAAREAPEKIRFPDLHGGLIGKTPGAGEFFPQARVRSNGVSGLFDDVVGPGLCLLARDRKALAALAASQRERWRRLNGRTVMLTGVAGESGTHPNGAQTIEDDGTYAEWFAARGCDAVIIRPDWYVYGTATGADEPGSLIDELHATLTAPR